MKATDCIRAAIELSTQMTLPLIEDLKEEALTLPTAQGGNHALWILGHLAHAEGMFYHFITGEENPLAHWDGLFGGSTEPVADAGHYPALDAVMGQFNEIRAKNIAILESLDDDGLDKKCTTVPDEFKDFFGTNGQCLMAIALHFMHHRGQLSDIRRSLKRKPLMA